MENIILLGNIEAFRALVFAGANVKLSNKRGETAIGLAQQSKKRDLFEQVMLEFVLEKDVKGATMWAPRIGWQVGASYKRDPWRPSQASNNRILLHLRLLFFFLSKYISMHLLCSDLPFP